jgi:peptidoglycan/LPS O-acetylase OafA/YrhL
MTSATADGLENSGGAASVTTDRPRPSLSEGLGGHRNSLGVLRLILASAVIFSHAFYLMGAPHDPFLDLVKQQESIGGIAVLGFFAISGYLITKSGASSDAVQFIWRRGLRILPAFWTVLIVTAFGVGPAIWLVMGRPLSTYFTLGEGGPVAYVLRNALLSIKQYGIYDIFVHTPYGATAGPVFNGSLWTLEYEWGAYLIIWALVIFGVLRNARVLVPVLTAFYLLLEIASRLVLHGAGMIFPYFGDPYRVTLPLIFLYGACLAVYSRRIPLDGRFAALAACLVVGSLAVGGFAVIGYPALAYLVLWLAAALPKSVQWIGAKNDYSYGVYVYGFLVQQITAFFGWYRWGYLPWTLACLVITFGCAWLSWHGVEKWAMRLKDRGPGRGIAHWRGIISSRSTSARSRRAARSAPVVADPAG